MTGDRLKGGILALIVVFALGAARAGWAASDLGAPETEKWQEAIDAAAKAGGGRVVVPKGRHPVGGLELRSNVELHLEEGAVLEALVGLEHYRRVTLPCSEGVWSAILMGLNVTNVALTGKGTVFGNGMRWEQPLCAGGNQEGLRARGIFFSGSRNIRLEDLTLRDAACWGCVFKCCDGVTVRRMTIDNHANYNNDGFDIEAANALFEDCDVDASDDAFVLKSNDPGFAVTNVIVRRSIARSHCNALKLGTASHGVMADILFQDIKVLPPKRDFLDTRPPSGNYGRSFWSNRKNYFDYPAGIGISGIAIECVDGGAVERVVCDNIEIEGYMVPFFVRGGTRTGRFCGTPPGNLYRLRDIVIRNVRGSAGREIASSVSGVDGCRAVNVTLENIDITCRGAGVKASREALEKPVPNVAGGYPEATMFNHILPAYGLWTDRTDNLVMRNVRFRLREGETDLRPEIVAPAGNQ